MQIAIIVRLARGEFQCKQLEQLIAVTHRAIDNVTKVGVRWEGKSKVAIERMAIEMIATQNETQHRVATSIVVQVLVGNIRKGQQ